MKEHVAASIVGGEATVLVDDDGKHFSVNGRRFASLSDAEEAARPGSVSRCAEAGNANLAAPGATPGASSGPLSGQAAAIPKGQASTETSAFKSPPGKIWGQVTTSGPGFCGGAAPSLEEMRGRVKATPFAAPVLVLRGTQDVGQPVVLSFQPHPSGA